MLEKTFNDYNSVAAKQTENPECGPYDAYGGGKSWDEWGKKFFHNLPLSMDDEFHVAIVTPVIHYCMGGLEIDANSNVVTTQGKPIMGLYAAGEIAGGVHGNQCCLFRGRGGGSIPLSQYPPARVQYPSIPSNFERFVLGCIEADFCKKNMRSRAGNSRLLPEWCTN